MVRRSSVHCSTWGVDILLADGEGPQTHVTEGKNVPRKVAVREHATQEIADLQQSMQPPQAERSAATKRLKATYYIWPEQDIALTAIQLYERQHARRCDKSSSSGKRSTCSSSNTTSRSDHHPYSQAWCRGHTRTVCTRGAPASSAREITCPYWTASAASAGLCWTDAATSMLRQP